MSSNRLDCSQYKSDMDRVSQGSEDVYDTFNILMRRKPKENNFKAVLETIRDLMNTDCVVPDWLHDIVLGYGDPGAAHYSNMSNRIATLDMNDTFLDFEHLSRSFPQHRIDASAVADPALLVPPFRLTFASKKVDDDDRPSIIVEPHVIPNRGPYPFNEPRRNAIRFTPTQIEAVRKTQ